MIIAAVKSSSKTGADNQSGDKKGNQPDDTDPRNNNPEQTGDKDQQDTEQNNSDNAQVVSDEGSGSVLPTVLKVGGTAAGASTVIAGGVVAVRSAKGSNNQKSETNKETVYAYVDSDKVKSAKAENEGKDGKNKADSNENNEDNNKDETSGINEDPDTAKDSIGESKRIMFSLGYSRLKVRR